MEMTAAVLRAPNTSLTLEALSIDAPHDDEILVKIAATGVCHTDIGVMHGHIPFPPTPCVLGHEGAGIVEAVGSAVIDLARGDHVVLSFSSCGTCERCRQGQPAYCDAFFQRNVLGSRSDGSATLHKGDETIYGCFFGQSSFATHAIVRALDAVKIPVDFPLDLAGPLGCGLQTGAGAVLNVLKPGGSDTLAVFGVGAVGAASIMAARASGCARIVAVDRHPGRLDLATRLGATDCVAADRDAVAKIRDIAGGGVHFSVEATGVPSVIPQAVEVLRPLGAAILLGVYPPTAPLGITAGMLGSGRTVRTSIEGDSDPRVTIPRLIDLYRTGHFPYDQCVQFYDLSRISEAIADSERGTTVKAVIRMPETP